MGKEAAEYVRELISTLRVIAKDTDNVSEHQIDVVILRTGSVMACFLNDVHRIADALEAMANVQATMAVGFVPDGQANMR